MTNPFRKQNPYQQYKEWCKTKKVQSVAGRLHHPNEVFKALVNFQTQIKNQISQ
jgi:hypothetical protein